MVRDDMESGKATTYKNKGLITPELISLPFFLRSSNICLKNCFSDNFFLRAFIFPHAKFLKTRNLHLLWLQTKLCLILTTPWLPVYKRFCTVVQFPARGLTQVLLCLFPGVLWLWHFLYSVCPHPVSSLHIYTLCCVAGIHGGCG